MFTRPNEMEAVLTALGAMAVHYSAIHAWERQARRLLRPALRRLHAGALRSSVDRAAADLRGAKTRRSPHALRPSPGNERRPRVVGRPAWAELRSRHQTLGG